jgi:acetyltransferase-like isoleucine patch superfamily enzyme
VGIASKCTLLPGASILEDSFLGVNSVVYRAAIGPNQVASGNPAVFIKDRYTDKGKQQQ